MTLFFCEFICADATSIIFRIPVQHIVVNMTSAARAVSCEARDVIRMRSRRRRDNGVVGVVEIECADATQSQAEVPEVSRIRILECTFAASFQRSITLWQRVGEVIALHPGVVGPAWCRRRMEELTESCRRDGLQFVIAVTSCRSLPFFGLRFDLD
jgi:hypothetical protein